MKAIIPVAGLGTRLRPHTYSTPKVLLPVAGKPMLAHILDELVDLGVEEISFIVHYLADPIQKWILDHYSFKSNFVDQTELLGLGHAISLAAPYHRDNDSVLIILGDTIFEADLGTILSWPENSIGVKSVEDPRRFGIVELEGEKVKRLIEKPEHPPTNLAIVGIYNITDPALLFDSLDEIIRENKTTRGEIQLTDALQRMLEKGTEFRTFEIDGWLDCGKPETLFDTNRRLLDRDGKKEDLETLRKRYPTSVILPPVSIHESAGITNSVIGPYVTVSEEVLLEHCIVKNSIISKKARIREILLDSSLIGEDTTISGNFSELNVGDQSIVAK